MASGVGSLSIARLSVSKHDTTVPVATQRELALGVSGQRAGTPVLARDIKNEG